MRHKYVITLNTEKAEMVLREFCELDKDIFTLVCEESYPFSVIQAAANRGVDHLVNTIRTRNFYPCGLFTTKIAEFVIKLFEAEADTVVDVFCDDVDYLTKKGESVPYIETIDDDTPDVDDLLGDDFVPDFDDDIDTKGVESSISIDLSSESEIEEDI